MRVKDVEGWGGRVDGVIGVGPGLEGWEYFVFDRIPPDGECEARIVEAGFEAILEIKTDNETASSLCAYVHLGHWPESSAFFS